MYTIIKLINLLFEESLATYIGIKISIDDLLIGIFLMVLPICLIIYILKKINDKYHILRTMWRSICHRSDIRMDI